MKSVEFDVPFPRQTITKTIYSITGNASFRKNFPSHICINGFQCSKGVTLHLDRSSIFSFTTYSSDVTFQNLHLNSFLQQSNRQNKPSNTPTNNNNFQPTLLVTHKHTRTVLIPFNFQFLSSSNLRNLVNPTNITFTRRLL